MKKSDTTFDMLAQITARLADALAAKPEERLSIVEMVRRRLTGDIATKSQSCHGSQEARPQSRKGTTDIPLDSWEVPYDAMAVLAKQKAEFKHNLAERMDRRGVSQAALGKLLGLTQPRISQIASGEHKPQQETLKNLAKALDCSVSDLWPSQSQANHDKPRALFWKDIYRRRRRIRLITLARDNKRNALTVEMLAFLRNLILETPRDTIIVFRGKGECFCAGLDKTEMEKLGSCERHITLYMELIDALSKREAICSIVQGAAVGGGMGIALFSHVVLASPEAKFVLPGDAQYRKLARVVVPIIASRRWLDPALFDQLLDPRLERQEIEPISFSARDGQAKHRLVDSVLDGTSTMAMLDDACDLLEDRCYLREAWRLHDEAVTVQFD